MSATPRLTFSKTKKKRLTGYDVSTKSVKIKPLLSKHLLTVGIFIEI